MFDGIKSIDKLAKSQLSNAQTTFNASLPVLLKVLAKTKGDTYLLRLGNTKITTKSTIALKVNGIYWANMQKNAAGQIILSSLTPQPDFIQNLKNAPLQLGFEDLNHLIQNPKAFIEEFRDFLLHQLASTTHKEEFHQLSLLLFSLQHSVLSLIITDQNKQYITQMRPNHKKQSLEFYAIFPHLGAIDGEIYKQENGLQATLNVMNHYVKSILEAHKSKLALESLIIACKHTPKPLFDFSHSLLDVRG